MTPYHDLLAAFGVPFARTRPDLAVPGSPERCLYRHVLEDASGGLWLLERLGPRQAARREALGLLLEALERRGLWGLAPYRAAVGGRYVLRDWGGFWQLSPFVVGLALERPGYLGHAAKGDGLARWMAALRRASSGLEPPPGLFALELPDYARQLAGRLARSRPGVHARLLPALAALAGFLEAWPGLPRALCHGDIHPLNAVWGETGPLAVIDWEFAGMRPAVYDLANCLGCVLLEARGDRDAPFARALLDRAGAEGLVDGPCGRWLWRAVAASRLGWLSEWLRKGDAQMLDTELDFLDFLTRGPDAPTR